MSSQKENCPQNRYRIKLLPSKNLVLVEFGNYESEMFTPQITNGRITFVNVIPNRRCCQTIKSNVTKEDEKYLKVRYSFESGKQSAMLAGHSHAKSAPLANSTPINVKYKNSFSDFISYDNCSTRSASCSLPTPELVRKDVLAHSSPKSIRVSRLYHHPADGVPKKIGCIAKYTINSKSARSPAHTSILRDSFKIPNSPIITTLACSLASDSNSKSAYVVDSISRWRKVLTPVRTYSRNSNKLDLVRHSTTSNKSNKVIKSRYKPTYLINSTKGPNVSLQFVVRKRKTIIDSKISISPKTFKKQQLNQSSMKSTTLYPNSLTFHKPRIYLETMGMSAFDLLTNSNRKHIMARKLNEQFRRRCVNKASSTYIKYKKLIHLQPLELDEEVLNLAVTTF